MGGEREPGASTRRAQARVELQLPPDCACLLPASGRAPMAPPRMRVLRAGGWAALPAARSVGAQCKTHREDPHRHVDKTVWLASCPNSRIRSEHAPPPFLPVGVKYRSRR